MAIPHNGYMTKNKMFQMAGIAGATMIGALAVTGVAGADQPPAGAPGACAQGSYAGCSGDGLNGGDGLSSNAVTAFWQELNILQNSSQTGEAVDSSGNVIYGGSALDAFVYALQGGYSFTWDTGVTTGVTTTTDPYGTQPGPGITFECVVVLGAPDYATFSAGPAVNGDCSYAWSEYPNALSITATPFTVTDDGTPVS